MYQEEVSLEATVEDMMDMEEKILQDLEGMVDIPKTAAVVATTAYFTIMVVDLVNMASMLSMVDLVNMVSVPC